MAANGLGPAWFPAWLRNILTKFGSHFFEEASWEKHDEGYRKGSPARHVCDRNFLKAMVRDASLANSSLKIITCMFLAMFLWSMTRLFGRLSYNYKSSID
jgi:hypothetical protein